ncbi:MAG TPA: tRNA pseudouridine(55) synthase TruB [Streptosporangiaceae bacterium]|nr:tRNA pseudouridine(55) synthase TruB [Streptosporangiaceae bacterium]
MNTGLVVVDKPAGWTSHDVVGKLRRLAGTRRVGHAGTLDPMATGVLVIGIDKATRLLGHLALTQKAYDATIRLGASTNTDDAEGEITATAPAAVVEAVTDEALRAAVKALTGRLQQVPPQVSAIKVGGERAYKRARQGAPVELAARPVTVDDFAVHDVRRRDGLIDLDASITCSSGTYIRALARDLGAALGTGGHLTVLRRTRVGPYDLAMARTIAQLTERLEVLPLADAVTAAFPRRDVSADEAGKVAHGVRLPAVGLGPGPVGVFGPDGALVALVEEHEGVAKSLAVFVP